MEDLTGPLVIGTISGFMLLAILTLTSFVKVSVVFMIIRQAIGLQQVPSNMIVLTLAALLSVFISFPILRDSVNAITAGNFDLSTVDGMIGFWNVGIAPFQTFIAQHIDPQHLDFFSIAATELWQGSGMVGEADNLVIQLPAFMISELTEAFKIGFLLYLPFIAIDLSITIILMALGMQMVQPSIIAVPFKLLVFVFVDGWARIIEGLLLTYQV